MLGTLKVENMVIDLEGKFLGLSLVDSFVMLKGYPHVIWCIQLFKIFILDISHLFLNHLKLLKVS